MNRLDTYDSLPDGVRRYLSNNGWHFSKKMCETACSKMKDRNGEKHTMVSKEQTDEYLRSAGVQLKNDTLYDACYVLNMAMADYYGSSMRDMNAIALFVKDYLDDIDGSGTRAMDEYVGRSIGCGHPIPWEDVL